MQQRPAHPLAKMPIWASAMPSACRPHQVVVECQIWESRQRWFFDDFHVDGSVCSFRQYLGHALRPTPDTLRSRTKIVTAKRRGKRVHIRILQEPWQAVLEPECLGISLCLNEFEKSVLGRTWLGISLCLKDIEYLLKVDAFLSKFTFLVDIFGKRTN